MPIGNEVIKKKLLLILIFVFACIYHNNLEVYLKARLVYLYFFISFFKEIWIARLFRQFKLQLKLNRPSGSQVNFCLERKDYIQSYAKEGNIKYVVVAQFTPSKVHMTKCAFSLIEV